MNGVGEQGVEENIWCKNKNETEAVKNYVIRISKMRQGD
jgi:hypothetical protein